MKLFALASLLVVIGLGCAVQTEPTSSDTTSSDPSALHGGCRVECPKCKPGEMCPMIACFEVCHECATDADCNLMQDYCTECACVALGPNGKLPHCSGPGVKCFADPCLNKQATCLSGRCVVQSAL